MKGFISYAHDDLDLVTDFRRHLAEVERAYDMPFWADDSILAGHHWNEQIKAAIDEAHVFLLMVSPSFFDSTYIRGNEIPAIQARIRAVGGLVCPVLLIRCPWEGRLGNLQIIPRNNRRLTPIIEWRPQDNGHDAARSQLDAAIRAHFKLIPKSEHWFTPLLTDEPDLPGPIWAEKDDQYDLDPSGGDSDALAAADPITRQLHDTNRPKAAALAANVSRLANSLGREWDGFIPAARKLADVIDRDTSELPDVVASLWEASVGLASFLDLDKRIRDTRPNDLDHLPLDIHRALDDLVGSVAPWVRRFPTAEGLDDARGAFLTNPGLFAPAKRLFEEARAENLTTPQAAEAMAASFDIAERGGAQADKARAYAMRGGFGLLRKFGKAVGTTLLSGTVGAFLGSAIDQSVKMKAIGAVLGRAGDSALEMAEALPADLANGMRWVIRRAGKPDFPRGDDGNTGDTQDQDQPSGLTEPPAPPPDDFLYRVHGMILRGEAPPVDWRRFITTLDFGPQSRFLANALSDNQKSFWSDAHFKRMTIRRRVQTGFDSDTGNPIFADTELETGYLSGHFVDLSPLAGLTALKFLSLKGTGVTDLTPLAGLKALQDLTLERTDVADLTGLGDLDSLQNLNLANTNVSHLGSLVRTVGRQYLSVGSSTRRDVLLLTGLTALRTLDLSGSLVSDFDLDGFLSLRSLNLKNTLIVDVTGLAELVTLEELDLTNTPVADVTALAWLSALKGLVLWGTQVADVTALAGLRLLHRLDLQSTKITEVTTLAGLTKLQFLDLSDTLVGDVIALAGLTALQKLDLRHTQVADVNALSGLTNLEYLDLGGTWVADVTALAGLTALRWLNLFGTQVTDISPLASIDGLTIIMPDGSDAKAGTAPPGEFRFGFNRLA